MMANGWTSSLPQAGSGPRADRRSWHAAGDRDVQPGGKAGRPGSSPTARTARRGCQPRARRTAQGVAGAADAVADLQGLVGDGVVGLADAAAVQVPPSRLVFDVRGAGRCSSRLPYTPAGACGGSCGVTFTARDDRAAAGGLGRWGVVQGGGLLGQGDDLLVGEVGGLDPAGDAVFGAQPGHAACLGVDLFGGVALDGPPWPEDGVGAGFGGAAERPPVAEQVPQRGGDDVGARAAGWPRRR